MSSENWPWDELGLEGETSDKRAVKHAYAKKLKTINQDEDIEAFTKLREAYDYALAVCKEEQADGEHEDFREYTSLVMEEDQDNSERASETPKSGKKLSDKLGAANENVESSTFFVDLLENKEKAELETGDDEDWDYLLSLSHKMQEQAGKREKAFDVSVWQAILEDPAVVSFEARKYVEEQVFRVLLEATAYGSNKNNPVSPDHMQSDFVELIDTHFGWVTDGVSFIRRFGDAGEWVLQAITISRLRFQEVRSGYHGESVLHSGQAMPFFLRWYVLLAIYFACRILMMS